MIAAATEEFATVEARFRYRYRSGEPSKTLAVVVVEGEEGQVTMSADVQGSVLNVHDILHCAFLFTPSDFTPATSSSATTTSLTSASATGTNSIWPTYAASPSRKRLWWRNDR